MHCLSPHVVLGSVSWEASTWCAVIVPKFILPTPSGEGSLVLLWLLIGATAPFAACYPFSLVSTAAVPCGRDCSVAKAGKGHVAPQALQYECKGVEWPFELHPAWLWWKFCLSMWVAEAEYLHQYWRQRKQLPHGCFSCCLQHLFQWELWQHSSVCGWAFPIAGTWQDVP